MLILLFSLPASPILSLSVSLQIRSPCLPIHSWYPYILPLFAGSLCVHVQNTYTSTLIPTSPISHPLRVSVRRLLSPLNISSFHSQLTCHVCVAVGLLQAVTISPRRLLSALQISCLYNYDFLCPTTLVHYSNSQLFSFLGSVMIFEMPPSRLNAPQRSLLFRINRCCRLDAILALQQKILDSKRLYSSVGSP